MKWVGILLGVVLLGIAGFVFSQVRAFDNSMSKVYDVPLRTVTRSTDPVVLERGRHLAHALGACTSCHGANLGGGKVEELGPLGRFVMPNITTGKDGRGANYSDEELARLIQHGLRKDGTSVPFMPSQDFAWWPPEDIDALISWIRQQPPVDGNPGKAELGALAKVLDRFDMIPLDIARRIDHANLPRAPAPAPTAEYGQYIVNSCQGCHGATLSGGPVPGAPPELPVPLNLTPHETGLKGWTYEDFTKLMREGKRKNGKQLDPFMPLDALKHMNDTELQAVWAYLQSLPPQPFGGR